LQVGLAQEFEHLWPEQEALALNAIGQYHDMGSACEVMPCYLALAAHLANALEGCEGLGRGKSASVQYDAVLGGYDKISEGPVRAECTARNQHRVTCAIQGLCAAPDPEDRVGLTVCT